MVKPCTYSDAKEGWVLVVIQVHLAVGADRPVEPNCAPRFNPLDSQVQKWYIFNRWIVSSVGRAADS